MGVVECNSINDTFVNFEKELIEENLGKTYNKVDKRIHNEYLKLLGKPNLESQIRSIPDNCKDKPYFEINSQLSQSKKISRFKKWYNMSYGYYNKEMNSTLQKKDSISTNNQSIHVGGHSSNSITSHSSHINNVNSRTPKQVSSNSNIIPYTNNDTHNNSKTSGNLITNSPSKQQNKNLVLKMPPIPNVAEEGIRLFSKYNKDKLLERVSKGPPESFRWLAWTVCGNLPKDIHSDLYYELLLGNLSVEDDLQIKKDLGRTIPDIPIFSINNNLEKLYRVLKAFALSDREVSYCQGMNFIAGNMLIISDFDEVESYYMMLSLFSFTFGDHLGVRGFFIDGFPLLQLYNYQFNNLFKTFLPELYQIVSDIGLPDEAWFGKWFQTLFMISLPRELTERVWDCIFSYGLDFLFNFTISLLKHLEPHLLRINDTVDFIEFFKLLHPSQCQSVDEKLKIELDYEDLIRSAKKIKIKKAVLLKLKLEFEKTNKIDLSKLNIRYDLSKSFSSSKDSNSNNSNNSSFLSSSLLHSPTPKHKMSHSRETSSKFVIPKDTDSPTRKILNFNHDEGPYLMHPRKASRSFTDNDAINLVLVSPKKTPESGNPYEQFVYPRSGKKKSTKKINIVESLAKIEDDMLDLNEDSIISEHEDDNIDIAVENKRSFHNILNLSKITQKMEKAHETKPTSQTPRNVTRTNNTVNNMNSKANTTESNKQNVNNNNTSELNGDELLNRSNSIKNFKVQTKEPSLSFVFKKPNIKPTPKYSNNGDQHSNQNSKR